jgi:hypothetical protein
MVCRCIIGKSRQMSLLQVKGPKMNPFLCGIFLCSLLAIFQHSRSMLNQLHQTTCAKISDQLVLMKDCHFVSGNHAFAGH